MKIGYEHKLNDNWPPVRIKDGTPVPFEEMTPRQKQIALAFATALIRPANNDTH